MFTGSEATREELQQAANNVEVALERKSDGIPGVSPAAPHQSSDRPWLRRIRSSLSGPFQRIRLRIAPVAKAIEDFTVGLWHVGGSHNQLKYLHDLAVPDLEEGIRRLSSQLHVLSSEIATAEKDLGRRIGGSNEVQAGHAAEFERFRNYVAAQFSSIAARQPAKMNMNTITEPSAISARLYSVIEEHFRGDREEIKRRQSVYLADIKDAAERTHSAIVLDLGCGRGEWLEVLRTVGLSSMGIDSHPAQLAEASKRGLAVVQSDALAFMAGEPAGKYAAVTAFQVAEHLSFETLGLWLVEALRILAPGGVAILETPNPGTVLVGSSSFYLDPTHVKPIPAELMTILLRGVGFASVDTRFLNPHGHLESALGSLPGDIAYLLFGYQDYAAIGVKPID